MIFYLSCGIFFLIYDWKYALGTECDVEEMNKCAKAFNYYESEKFPNYGENENDLEETCMKMNVTLSCPSKYDICEIDESCDSGACHEVLKTLQSIKKFGTLGLFFEQLCEKESSFRERYLTHASCLEKTSASYVECYNTSAASFLYMTENNLASYENICCFHTWVIGCYTKETTTACGKDAADVVNEALGMLKQQFESVCVDAEQCDRPPLPKSAGSDKNNITTTEVPLISTAGDISSIKPSKAPLLNGSSALFVTAFFTLIFTPVWISTA